MHQAAYEFVGSVAAGLDLDGATVLEIGSYNVNGTIRPHFAAAAQYIGIDRRAGPDVDVVSETYDGEPVDVVVCCEVLEHTAEPQAVIAAAWDALTPGGLLILTAAGPGRWPHNTMGGPDLGDEPYANIEPDDLRAWLGGWGDAVVRHDKGLGDVYAVAHKPAPKRKKKAAPKKEKGESADTTDIPR